MASKRSPRAEEVSYRSNDVAPPAAAVTTRVEPLESTETLSVVKLENEERVPMESPPDSRWKRDEHARFMLALEKFGGGRTGNEWRKIAAFVQTRPLTEVRLHGQQYLRHLVQTHNFQLSHTQQQLHLQHQQAKLLQLGRLGLANGMEHPLTASRELQVIANSQNDPNGPNGSAAIPAAAVKLVKAAIVSSVDANVASPYSLDVRSVGRKANTSVASNSQRFKAWSFQEDKALETALASCQRGKPYSWAKIAAALPGKTAKDARLRYEQLVEDIAAIETNGVTTASSTTTLHPVSSISVTPSARPPKVPTTRSTGRPAQHSSLSSRIAPPPPIQVPPPLSARGKSSGLLDSPGILSGNHHGRFALTPSLGTVSGMLSPTFLEFLANEDKPAMPYSGLADLPSPFLPSPVVTSGGARGGALASPLAFDLNTPGGKRGRRHFVTPRGHVTPRIWTEFLADDFKLEPKGSELSSSAMHSSSSAGNRVPTKAENQVPGERGVAKCQDPMKTE